MDNPVKRQIEAYMQANGLNQREFAARAGIGKGGLNLILLETTIPGNIKAETLRKAAKLLGISMEQLLTGEPGSGADAVVQFRNDVEALQIVARSLAQALSSNLRRAGSDLADAIDADANSPARPKPFATDSGLLLEVLSILGQDAQASGGAAPPRAPSGSAR